MLEIKDLTEEKTLLTQYVALRNRFADLLLTSSVTLKETKKWLHDENVIIKCMVDNNVLLGVAILYLDKKGEIAVFAKNQGRGIGKKMIKAIEKAAKEKKLNSVWAWVLKENIIAQRAFEKNGFVKDGTKERDFKGTLKNGIKYKKIIKLQTS